LQLCGLVKMVGGDTIFNVTFTLSDLSHPKVETSAQPDARCLRIALSRTNLPALPVKLSFHHCCTHLLRVCQQVDWQLHFPRPTVLAALVMLTRSGSFLVSPQGAYNPFGT
jgi:hypothetical protein